VHVRPVEDADVGRADLLAGRLDVLIAPPPKDHPGRLRVLVAHDIPPLLAGPLENVARQEALLAQVAAVGLDREEVDEAVSQARVDLVKLRPGREYDPERIGLGILAGIFVYVALLLSGQQVAQGVVEEKSSRIVELLLTAIRPWQLMVGKVVGIGLIGLAQLGATAGTGVALGLVTGSFTLPAATATGVVVWTLVWFVLGFAAYALLFAAVGALVSRQEEVGGVTSPVMFVIIAPYILGVSVLPGDPGNSLVAVLSMIPIFAPTLMPMRVALGVPVWQLSVSVGAMLLLIGWLAWLAGRVYGNAVLRTGTRVRLRDALRAA
jgi:ABC-2 type transport system permease protein